MALTKDHRLVTYGTLAPGRTNHHQLAGLEGRWFEGKVRGRLLDGGWGAAHGCPGIRLDDNGQDVDVFVFESADLPDHWARLDAFEGDSYRRLPVYVYTDAGEIEASIYELAIPF